MTPRLHVCVPVVGWDVMTVGHLTEGSVMCLSCAYMVVYERWMGSEMMRVGGK